jgi:GMP synthase-like glutamine amidotransferase
MILVVDVCSDKLGYFEFVKPVEDILKKAGAGFLTRGFLAVRHSDIASTEKTIICGTALKDFKYLDNIDRFAWIMESRAAVLGICAGMQILARLFNGDIIERTRIGRYKVKTVLRNSLSSKDEFYAYFLNSKAVEPSEDFETLGKSADLSCMIKHRRERFYGCLFHPEVLNPEIITNFMKDGAHADEV